MQSSLICLFVFFYVIHDVKNSITYKCRKNKKKRENECMTLNLKLEFVKKKKRKKEKSKYKMEYSVGFYLPEDLCPVILKENFCVLGVQLSWPSVFIMKDNSSSKPIV